MIRFSQKAKTLAEENVTQENVTHKRKSFVGIVIIWHVLCYVEVKAGIVFSIAGSQSGSICTSRMEGHALSI